MHAAAPVMPGHTSSTPLSSMCSGLSSAADGAPVAVRNHAAAMHCISCTPPTIPPRGLPPDRRPAIEKKKGYSTEPCSTSCRPGDTTQQPSCRPARAPSSRWASPYSSARQHRAVIACRASPAAAWAGQARCMVHG